MSDSLFVDIPASESGGDNVPATIPEGDEAMEDILDASMIETGVEDNGKGDPPEEEEDKTAEEEQEERSESPSPFTMTFLDHLQTPTVTLNVGDPETTTPAKMTAHMSLLKKSPYFRTHFKSHPSPDDPDRLKVDLPSDDLSAVGCFVQYLYTGDYFPRLLKVNGDEVLEDDPNRPEMDEDGTDLLKHARVYTLAHKFGVRELKTLAHKKIHKINGSAKGEVAYARFVYGNTPTDDRTIRSPVAAFWSHKGHILRHEAEMEFKKMVLDYPQFGLDVLTLLLDAKEKEPGRHSAAAAAGGRKRARVSMA